LGTPVTNKNDLFLWGVSVLKKAVDEQVYGNVVFSMQNGFLVSSKTEAVEKPPVDMSAKTT
jgi:hypothetical protein